MNKGKNNSTECPICGRPTHKKSEYCIFHASAEEKTEDEFIKELKKYIKKIKKEDKGYKFKKFIFIGNIDFKEDLNITILENADFNMAIFENAITFSNLIFKGSTDFENAKFNKTEGILEFSNIKFEGSVNFDKVIFFDNALFTRVRFRKNVNFKHSCFESYFLCNHIRVYKDISFDEATFKSNVDFLKSICLGNFSLEYAGIKEDMIFSKMRLGGLSVGFSIFNKHELMKNSIIRKTLYSYGVVYHGMASFMRTKIKGPAYFSSSRFEKFINLNESIFFNHVYFNSCYFPQKTYIGINAKGEGRIDFAYADIEYCTMNFDIEKDVSINFSNSYMRNTLIQKEQIEKNIYQIKIDKFNINRNKYNDAKKVFLSLKTNFHSLGQYEDESWAFKKEKDMERKSYCHFKSLHKWLWSCFLNAIYGYGEKPWNVVITAVAIILIFALSFSFIGIANPEIIELTGTAIHQNSVNIVDLSSKGLIKNNIVRNFPDSLYFSTITFTTLGYGDFRPLEGWGRILAGSEAFIGAFMMALFVYTFARRTGGR